MEKIKAWIDDARINTLTVLIMQVPCCMGLLNLAQRHPCDLIENACEIALSHDAFRLRTIRELIKKGGSKQEPLEFIDEHPIIRQMSDYGEFVKDCFG